MPAQGGRSYVGHLPRVMESAGPPSCVVATADEVTLRCPRRHVISLHTRHPACRLPASPRSGLPSPDDREHADQLGRGIDIASKQPAGGSSPSRRTDLGKCPRSLADWRSANQAARHRPVHTAHGHTVLNAKTRDGAAQAVSYSAGTADNWGTSHVAFAAPHLDHVIPHGDSVRVVVGLAIEKV